MAKLHIKGIAGLLLVLVLVTPALAFTITINGTFSDWDTLPPQPGVVVINDFASDDENQAAADVTSFGAATDSGGLYLLEAWDDTGFTQPSDVGIILGCGSLYYHIYTFANGNPASVALSTLMIYTCVDATCRSESELCSNRDATPPICTGTQVASGTRADPWATRSKPQCSGTACGTNDTAAEIYVPWSLGLCGGTQPQMAISLNLYSHPSAPSNEVKDTAGSGISYSPTAVKLLSFTGRPAANSVRLEWETATEQDNVGFNLYRREAGTQAYARLNAALIPSKAPGQTMGASYTYIDEDIIAGRTYEYLLEDVDMAGERTQHGPVAATTLYTAFLMLLER